MFLEIFMYLVISFGILILCITMFEREIDEKYVVIKRGKAKINVIVEVEGVNEEDAKKIGWIIRKGKFQDICDVVHDFKIVDLKK